MELKLATAIRCRRWAVALLLCWLPLNAAVADEEDPQTILVGGDYWCPYVCTPKTEREGYLIEVLREVFVRHGYKLRFRLYPWQRALQLTEIGRIDGAVGAVAGNRGANIIGTQSLGRDETVIVHRSDHSFIYSEPGDLNGFRIGLVADYTYDNHGRLDAYLAERLAAQDNTLLVVTQSRPLEQLFRLLTIDRIQVFPENKYVVAYNARVQGLEDQIAYQPHSHGDDIYVAFSPSKRGKKLLKLFDEGVERLRHSGKLERILARYGITYEL